MHDRSQRSRPAARRRREAVAPGWTRWRALQCVTALWLLASPVAYASDAATAVIAKDLVAGLVLLGVTVPAAVRRSTRTVEDTTCVVLGCLLVAGSFVLDHSSDGGPLTAQWSELVVGVLLVSLGAAKIR